MSEANPLLCLSYRAAHHVHDRRYDEYEYLESDFCVLEGDTPEEMARAIHERIRWHPTKSYLNFVVRDWRDVVGLVNNGTCEKVGEDSIVVYGWWDNDEHGHNDDQSLQQDLREQVAKLLGDKSQAYARKLKAEREARENAARSAELERERAKWEIERPAREAKWAAEEAAKKAKELALLDQLLKKYPERTAKPC